MRAVTSASPNVLEIDEVPEPHERGNTDARLLPDGHGLADQRVQHPARDRDPRPVVDLRDDRRILLGSQPADHPHLAAK